MYKYITFLLLFMVNIGQSQSPLFNPEETVMVTSDPLYGHIYVHKLKTKQTIYSLAKFFNTTVNDIYQLNFKDKDYVFKVDELVSIPFDPFLLQTDPDQIRLISKKVRVAYQVQPKDNLFRISRVLFPQSMNHLMENNHMKDYNLSINKQVTVGYISMDPATFNPNTNPNNLITIASLNHIEYTLNHHRDIIKDLNVNMDESNDSPTYVGDVETKEAELLDELKIDDLLIAAEEKSNVTLISNSGIALWDKKITDKENLFVMHKTAKVNSVIEIYYPLLNRTIEAQVVGNIPRGLYSDDIEVIISPKVAQKLGVIDNVFRVDMKYYNKG